MAVIFYRHTYFDPVGFVGDFCPVCGDFRSFAVESEETEQRLYFLPTGEPRVMSTRAQCAGCGYIKLINPKDYARFNPEAEDLDTLLQETNPNIREKRAADLALWEKLRQSPESLTAEERQRVVDCVLAAMKSTLTLRHAVTNQTNIRLNPPVAIAVAGPFLLTLLGLVLFDKRFEQMSAKGNIILLLTGFFVLPIVCGRAMWLRQKRCLRQHAEGMFATGTRPLQLGPEELRELVTHSAVNHAQVRETALASIGKQTAGNPGNAEP